MLYVAVGLIVAEIPRLYYMCMLCGYVCCGGKTKDTVADREKCVNAMNALIISVALSAVLTLVITLAAGGDIGGVVTVLLNYAITAAVAFWWRSDVMSWVAAKKAMTA